MTNCTTAIGFIRTLPMGAMGDNRTGMPREGSPCALAPASCEAIAFETAKKKRPVT